MLRKENLTTSLVRLDQELAKQGLRREITVCGGAALLLLKSTNRETRDIDVIAPVLDRDFKDIISKLGKELDHYPEWVNNGPESLVRDLPVGWETRTTEVFSGSALNTRALGHLDLLATKLYAFCDREDDFQDVLILRPSVQEIEKLRPWILERDGSAYWPDRVKDCLERLLNRIKGVSRHE